MLRIRFITLLIITLLANYAAVQAEKPIADFTASVTSGCAPLSVGFTNKSLNSPTSFKWDLGNGQLPVTKNAATTYLLPGVYKVRLVVSNADGIDDEIKDNYITVFPSATVNFKANKNIGCSPSIIQFLDDTTVPSGSITGWLWDFGDGTTATVQNPAHTYSNIGYYSVSLTITTSSGCTPSKSRTRFIRIIGGVKANFDFNRSGDCQVPVNVNFINQTSAPGTVQYNWSFDNGSSSTIKNPSTLYNVLANYNVKLVASSSFGCMDSITKPIAILAKNASFDAPDTICLAKLISFTNTSTPSGLGAVWDFGDGSGSTAISPVKAYAAPGTYMITLNNQFADCKGSFSKQIVVTGAPLIDFNTTNNLGCKIPQNVQFQDANNNSSNWSWDFGDGTSSTIKDPSHTYLTAGNYTVTLVANTANGCTGTVTKTDLVQIKAPGVIQVDSLPAEGCLPLTIHPIPKITTTDGIASYNWNFGAGGGNSTLQNPSYTYNSLGTFTVSLQVVTKGGCTINYVLPAAVKTGTLPFVDFNTVTDTTCAGDAVMFTSLAAPADKWLWEFGDNGSSTIENPSHQYLDTGIMSVTLNAWNNGCKNTKTLTDLVYIKGPVGNFIPLYNCINPLQVNFQNKSVTIPTHSAPIYSWDFGDGTPVLVGVFEPTHTYSALGNYTVTLTVTDNVCSYVKKKSINLFTINPDFTLNKAQYCRGEFFTLATNGIDDSKVSSYTWTIGSGTPVVAGYQYDSVITNNGLYNVRLQTKDINGCLTSSVKNNYLEIVGATADFKVVNNGACLNTSITIQDASVPAGSIQNWNFDFGDGTSASFNAPPFTHLYNNSGNYTIKLSAKDNLGCTDTITKVASAAITKPLVNFKASDTLFCPNTNILFSDSSLGNSLSYSWDFGDGNLSNLKNSLHNYANFDSSYSVKLIVTDALGCADSLIKTNYIRIASPKALFSIYDSSAICPPLETKFEASPLNYDSLYWDFGDGNTSTLPFTSNFYNTYGNYKPTLYVRGYGGCYDSLSANVNVYNAFISTNFKFSPDSGCTQVDVNFSATPPPNTKFKIYFGDGTVDSSQNKTVSHKYINPSFYNPYVQVEDSLDCLLTVGSGKQIKVKGVYPLFDINQKNFCDTGTVQLTDYSIGNDSIINRTWDFGDGTTSNSINPLKKYGSPGLYSISQQITTATGCTDTYNDTVKIYRTPTPIINGPASICIETNLFLQASTAFVDTAITWSWVSSLGTSSNISIINNYTSAGQDKIFLKATNSLGCSNETSQTIDIWPLPEIMNEPIIVIPLNASVTLPVTYSSGVNVWNWNPAATLSCPDCGNPVASPRLSTKYTISVTDIHGCRAFGNIEVRVVCQDKNYFIPNTFSPNNDGQNDVFYPRGNAVYRIQSMRIFNRWGEIVFERKNFPANSPSDGWNGLVKGVPAQSDAYVYIIEVICDNAQIVPIKGNVTILR